MCGQHANDMDNVHLCRQCAETKLYMIGYIKSTRDDIWMTSALSFFVFNIFFIPFFIYTFAERCCLRWQLNNAYINCS